MTGIESIISDHELMQLARLSLAALAGACIGMEREKHGRPAGLRTHLLVAVGSCLMMLISEEFYVKYGALSGSGVVRIDPSRIAAQIVTGIGFLGAGVILKEGISVRGLTTAACLWMAAGLGMAFGAGLYTIGFLSTFLSLASLIFLKKLEPVIRKDRFLTMIVRAGIEEDIYDRLEQVFGEHGMWISSIASELDLEGREVRYEFVLTRHKKRMGMELTHAISALPGVRRVTFR